MCRGQHVLSKTVKCPDMAKLAMAYGVGVSGVSEFIKGVLGVAELNPRHVNDVIKYMRDSSCASTS